MSLYRTVDGDRIDLIVLKHYGDLTHLNDVISANPILFDISLDLNAGVEINLPAFKVESGPVVKESATRW